MDKTSYLNAARQHCEQRGSRLTAQREQVLALAFDHPGVVKAYQVLADMQAERGVTAPPTVYRALDFLVEQGLLHRVEALNGYVVCQHFDCPHDSLVLVCEQCGIVDELDAAGSLGSLTAVLAERGFLPHSQNIVLTGVCRACRQ